jgi:hypothetical protein
VKANPELNILIVDELSTRLSMALDANLIQKNVYVTSPGKLKEAGLLGSVLLSDQEIPVIWSADLSSYPKRRIDRIITRRYKMSLAGKNVKKLESDCTRNYEIFQVRKSGKPVRLFPDYLDVGDAIRFTGDEWNSGEYIDSGLSGKEESFIWTDGTKVDFERFKLGSKMSSHSFLMKLEIESICGPKQLIIVKNNGSFCGQEEIREGGTVTIPVKTDDQGYLDLSIMLPYAISPEEWTGMPDNRQLGIALKSIVFERPGSTDSTGSIGSIGSTDSTGSTNESEEQNNR